CCHQQYAGHGQPSVLILGKSAICYRNGNSMLLPKGSGRNIVMMAIALQIRTHTLHGIILISLLTTKHNSYRPV
ncbi:hypothetical protein KKG56_06785, partial [bacterium]|nr:hypothetical protein [bacterium]